MLFFFISRESSSPKRYENMFEKMLLYIVECSMLCIKNISFSFFSSSFMTSVRQVVKFCTKSL